MLYVKWTFLLHYNLLENRNGLSYRKMETVKTECYSHVPLNVTKIYIYQRNFFHCLISEYWLVKYGELLKKDIFSREFKHSMLEDF